MQAYRQINLVLESFCLILSLLLIVHLILDRKSGDKSNGWFLGMTTSNIFMLLGDMCDWAFTGIPGTGIHVLLWIGLTVFFVSSAVMMFNFLGYVISRINMSSPEGSPKVPRLWLKIGAGVSAALILITVSSPFTHFVFYFTGVDNLYYRGILFYSTQVAAYGTYAVSVFLTIRYRRVLKRKDLLFLLVYVGIPLIAQPIQVITYQIASLNASLTLALVLVFIFVQSETKLQMEKRENDLMMIATNHMEILREQQDHLIDQLITVLGNTMEAKDIYTNGHSVRVANYVREIVYRLGGDEEEQQQAYYIGLLHDVGKIRVPDTIINKKGKLTEAEFSQIKLHPVAGYHILKGITIIPDLAVGARWHHERYDGKGYPNGLSGENIPRIARVVSVADAYDAMTSNRSYRDIMPQEKVRRQIEKGLGTQFDPVIGKVMLEMIDEDTEYTMKQVNSAYEESILVVDNEESVFRSIQRCLRDEDYMLTYANSAEEGILLLQEEKFDLVLLDLDISGINGFDVLEWIRKNMRGMKVIFMTGDQNPDIKQSDIIQRGKELRVNDYISKPLLAPLMKESISNVLRHG